MREAAVVMAAGKGTRMHSELPKVCHLAAGRPLVQWVVQACREAGIERIVVVVGYREELVREALAGQPVDYARQTEQLGTGHAAAQARSVLGELTGRLFVLNGDAPLISGEVLSQMRRQHAAAGADATLLSITPRQSLPYGRILRDPAGRIYDVVEEKDCTPEQQALRELNAGFYVFNAPEIWGVLAALPNTNRQGEYYV
ncbi:MAG: NTP transferase domain-containing protein, partial [Armatimonadetes bacterium]|nr:NTP transferase domain-containing protein [Armatimonadota bacterium]